jgi:hypothetical protein
MIQQNYAILVLIALVFGMNVLGLSFTINRNIRAKRQSSDHAQQKPQGIFEHV